MSIYIERLQNTIRRQLADDLTYGSLKELLFHLFLLI